VHADQTAFKLEGYLLHRLNVCVNLVSRAFSSIYSDRHKIGVPEWRVLVMLGQWGLMTAKAIGIHSQIHTTKVSRAVALLERRKWVTRRAIRADLREAFLSLTPPGRDIYYEIAPIAFDFVRKLIDTVDTANHTVLDRAPKKFTERSARLARDLANSGGGR
jgi:DNA-binding MarR family transcriptional regulator